ncbi:MAG TPA: hypothetical protein DCQ53_08155, partial [Alphaproteobacteria bacterium]|nr:hypothetical protein [Alphaproteobacteria bacterium]
MTRIHSSARALSIAVILAAAAPSDGQNFTPAHTLIDLSEPNTALPLDAATPLRPGMVVRLPDGAAGVRVRIDTVRARPLGDVAITGHVDGSGEPVRLTLGGTGFYAAAGMEGWRPSSGGRGEWLSPGSLALADLGAEERLVVSRTLATLPAVQSGVIEIEARLSDSFVRRHGLASRLRAQHLAEAVNAALAEAGRDVTLELTALRGAEAGQSATPGIALAALDAIAADVIVAAVLPSSRAVQVGNPATAFATIINAGASEAAACGLALTGAAPAGSFSYQVTDALNLPTG